MTIKIMVKGLVVNGLFLGCLAAQAWTVSEWVVDMPSEVGESKGATLDIPQKPKKLSHATLEPVEKKSATSFEKTEAATTGEEQAVNDYRRALQHLAQGESLQAEKLLRNSLIQFPNYHDARAELSTVYLKRNQIEEAEVILQEGLSLDENNADFLRLMAMVYDRKGDPEAALALLVKVKDSRKDKSYVAFLGHIYQETGRYALARQQYYRLLQEEPKNPLWLLGVSVALDGEGQRGPALEGYRRLLSEGNVDPAILKYVQERVDLLS